jgi:hypothetical protein
MGQNDRYFIIGLMALAVSLFLFPLSLYILPQVWFGWTYHIPDFILSLSNWLQDNLEFKEGEASWFIFYSFFFTACIFAGIAYVASARANANMKKNVVRLPFDDAEKRIKQVRQDRRDSTFLVIKMIGIGILVFVVAEIMQWAIAIAPS